VVCAADRAGLGRGVAHCPAELSQRAHQQTVPGILWYCLPWGIIGMFSGVVISGFPSKRAAREEAPLWPCREPRR
jgi:hypothetical protein